MQSRLNPYLNFTDNARDAMTYYQEVFGGELNVSTFGEFGMAGSPQENQIMHAQLETPSGFTLMASDTAPGMEVPSGNGAISLSGDDEAELTGYWDKLSQGGNVVMPMEKQMWGDIYGMCVDKFGVLWHVDVVQGSQPA